MAKFIKYWTCVLTGYNNGMVIVGYRWPNGGISSWTYVDRTRAKGGYNKAVHCVERVYQRNTLTQFLLNDTKTVCSHHTDAALHMMGNEA